MDLYRMISELKEQLRQVDEVIAILEALDNDAKLYPRRRKDQTSEKRPRKL